MELEIEKYKKFIHYTMKNFKALESELFAYRLVFRMVKDFDPSQYETMTQAFQYILTSEPLQKLMREKYDVALEKVLKQVDEGSQDQVLQWLEDWKPEGPANQIWAHGTLH